MIDLTNSTVSLGTLTLGTTTPNLVLTNTTLNGPGTLTIGAGSTLTANATTFNVPVVNQGTLDVVNGSANSATVFNKSVTNAAGANFKYENSSSALVLNGGFANSGTVLFSPQTGSPELVFISNTSLVNGATGVVNVDGSANVGIVVQGSYTKCHGRIP